MDAPAATAGPVALTWRRLVGAALAVAAVATAGSLTYSLGLGLYPCRLCWYQRVLLYPLVVVLGYALARDHRDVHLAVGPLVVPGAAVAAYHSYLQVTAGGTCGVVACATVQYRVAGLTIPNQSLLAFLLVAALVACGTLADRGRWPPRFWRWGANRRS